MAIGERIRTFRKRKGLTQKELGVQLGLRKVLLISAWLNMKQRNVFPRMI